ncbi:hypothetical protein GQ54DRAFT_295920 [Martensiomyces pterosporus]|nr:hypothetical protein GQ54DRAFT_295920 [Martensiomyces pterosporus]
MSPADTCATTGAEDSDSDEYLIANIALYLVSKKLSIMVCHYENTPARGLLPTSTQGSSKATSAGSSLSSSLSPTIQCDCISNASMMADAERVQHLLSQIHKLDIIDTPQGLSRGMSGGGNSILGSVGSSLASRHAQIYSIDTERLLCAFPEEGYTKVFGKSPFDATKEGVNLRSLWKVGSEGRVEGDVLGLLQCPCVPSSDPIRLELQIKNSSTGALAGVQTILFRWGHLLFVCQQVRSENSPDASSISTVGGDDNILSRYNLSTPPGDDATRNDASDHGARHDPGSHGYAGNRSTARLRTTRSAVVLQSNSPMLPLSQRTALGQQQQQQPGPLVETRPFSIPRAPASVAASLPPRPAFALTPPESVPPRRQSSYTLPPAKSFEERRFSYPIQALNGERRQPPAPSLLANSHGVAASGAAAGAAGIRGSPASLSSPGSRVLELRQRVGAAGGGGNLQMGSGGAAVPKGGEASNQPTPAVSPLASSTHHHTPVSLSPAPQPPSANQGGYVQVNLYPPPHETGESWRWPQAPHILAQPQMQPHHSQQQQQHQHQQHQLLAFNMSPNQRPPIRNPNSPHPHLLLNAVHDQYQSPVASAVASPSMAGPIVHRIEPEKKTCKSCGTDSSPEWRKGPTGHKTLCNACGLRYARSINRANKKMAG